jgi:hypothetical protein
MSSDSRRDRVDAVRVEARVRRSIDDAFDLFTRDVGAWWPLDRASFGGDRALEVHFEPYVGGRFYEALHRRRRTHRWTGAALGPTELCRLHLAARRMARTDRGRRAIRRRSRTCHASRTRTPSLESARRSRRTNARDVQQRLADRHRLLRVTGGSRLNLPADDQEVDLTDWARHASLLRPWAPSATPSPKPSGHTQVS